MYRHMADSIKETDDKMFISQSDKDKYDNYSFMRKEDTYDKTTIDKIAEELCVSGITHEGVDIVSELKSKKGFINNFEINGNTIQNESIIKYVTHLGEKDGLNYKIKVKSVGKNLFNKEEFYNQIKHIKGVFLTDRGIKFDGGINNGVCNNIMNVSPLNSLKFDPSKKYIIQAKRINSGDLRVIIHFNYVDNSSPVVKYDGDTYYIYSIPGVEINGLNIVWNTQVNGDYTILEDIMIYEIEEDNATPITEYYPYRESVQEIVLDNPLRKINDSVDKILVKNNKMTEVRNVGVLKFHKDEINITNCSEINGFVKCYIPVFNSKSLIMTNFLPFIENSSTDSEYVCIEEVDNVTKNIIVSISSTNLVGYTEYELTDRIKSYLKDIKAEIFYQLETSIIYEKDAILNIQSHDDGTVVSVDSNISSTAFKCIIPINTGDIISSSNKQLEVLKNKVSDIKNIVSDNTLRREFVSGDIYDGNLGYIEDFEIKGKTVIDLAQKFNNSVVGSTIGERNVIIDSGVNYCKIIAHEEFTVNDYGGWGYILFSGISINDLKPNTKYKVSVDFNSNYDFKKPSFSLRNSDSSVVNTVTSGVPSYNLGKLTTIMETKSDLSEAGCNFFIGLDGCSFRQGQVIIIKNISIVEYDENEDLIMNEKVNTIHDTLINVGDRELTIRNTNSNLIDISKFTDKSIDIDNLLLISQPNLKVEFDTADSIIVHNTSEIGTAATDSFVVFNPYECEYFGDLIVGEEYELTWDCELLEGDLLQGSEQNYAMVYLLSHIPGSVGVFRGFTYNGNPYFNKRLKFTYNNIDKRDFSFRINVNKSGLKLRFFNIKLTPVNDTSNSNMMGSNSVTIDLSKYGIENGLKSLPDGTCDRIFKRNGKYYLEQNIKSMCMDQEVVDNIYLANDSGDRIQVGVVISNIRGMDVMSGVNINLVSNIFPLSANENYRGNFSMYISYNSKSQQTLYVRVPKSLLNEPTLAAVKDFILLNSVIIYYPLQNSIITEIDENLDLISYNGKNTIIVENNNLSPLVSFKLPGNINNNVNVLTDKIKKIQSNNKKIDSLTLKALYNADRSKLDLSLMVNSRTVNNVDYDLYELIEKVILSNSSQKELLGDIIEFFFMIDKLNMEMTDRLFSLL